MSLRMDMIYAIRDIVQTWDALSSKCVFMEDRRAPKRSRTEDFESIYCVSNKHTYKRVRLDPNEEDSKGVKVDCPSGDAKACNDVLSIPKVTCHISPEHSGPSFKEWRTSSAGPASQKSDVIEPVSAKICRKKIEDNRVERVVDILSKLVERLKI